MELFNDNHEGSGGC